MYAGSGGAAQSGHKQSGLGGKLVAGGLGLAGGTLLGGKMLLDDSSKDSELDCYKVLLVMRGEVVSIDKTGGPMEWVLQETLVDMGK